MPQVTAIEPQKKSGRFNVFLDNQFGFAIDENNLAQSHLKIAKVLTKEQIDTFTTKNQIGKLTDQSLRFLSYRPRSVKEVADYLAKKIATSENIKFRQAQESPQIKKIITKLKKYNYLNDVDFTKWLVSSRARSHTKGLSHMRLELKAKGVDPEIIEITLEELVNESQLAKAALSKKVKKWHNLSGLELKKKVYQYLSSHGFSYDTIKEAFANHQKKD